MAFLPAAHRLKPDTVQNVRMFWFRFKLLDLSFFHFYRHAGTCFTYFCWPQRACHGTHESASELLPQRRQVIYWCCQQQIKGNFDIRALAQQQRQWFICTLSLHVYKTGQPNKRNNVALFRNVSQCATFISAQAEMKDQIKNQRDNHRTDVLYTQGRVS